MKKSSILLWIFFIIHQFNAFSQTGLPPSPNATSLANFVANPIGLYTGIPDINIPIYTLKSRQLSVPISLSYHGGGIKVEEVASDVGLGWSLNAGGVIARQVRGGKPDEATDGYFNNGYYWIPSAPHVPVNTYDYGFTDGEPDIFYFNFLGRAGQIIFEHNPEAGKPPIPHITPKQDIQVVPSISGNQIWQFVIITEDGTKFTFSHTENTHAERSEYYGFGLPPNNFSDYKSAWYLSKIEAPGVTDAIYFSYFYTDPYTITLHNSWAYHYPNCDWATNNPIVDSDPNAGTVYNNSYTITGCVLLSISTKNIRVYFDYYGDRSSRGRCDLNYLVFDPNFETQHNYPKSLKGIYVDANYAGVFDDDDDISNKNAWGVPYGHFDLYCIKKFILTHSYSNSTTTGIAESDALCVPGSGQTQYRLMLDRVTEQNGDGSVSLPPYEFTYNSGLLYDRIASLGIDYWGYKNCANNTSLVPQETFTDYNGNTVTRPPSPPPPGGYSTYHCNRAPCISGAKAMVLEGIKYPTGGTTQYNWDLNTCQSNLPLPNTLKISGETHYAGGLRISSIVSNDNNGNLTTENYDYTKPDGSTSGVIVGFNSFKSSEKVGQYISGNYVFNDYIVIRSFSNYPLSTTYGNTVGYEYVTVNKGDLGKVTTQFYTANDYPDVYETYISDGSGGWDNITLNSTTGLLTSAYVPAYSADWKRGLVKEMVAKDKNNNLIKKTSYSYRCDEPASSIMCIANGVNLVNGYSKCYHTKSDALCRLETINEFTYDPSNSAKYVQNTTSTFYDNPDHLMPTYSQTTDGKGGYTIIKTQYMGDYSETPEFADMRLNHIISPVVKQNVYTKKSNTDLYLLNSTLSNYGESYSLIHPYEVFEAKISSPVLSASNDYTYTGPYTYSIPSNYRKVGDFSYDAFNNIIETTPFNGIPSSISYAYNNTFPVIKAVNAKSNMIFFSGFENTISTTLHEAEWNSSLTAFDIIKKHTGRYSGRIDKPTSGALQSHSNIWINVNLSAPTKFKYSGWVYSDGPTAYIYLYMKTASETGGYTYVDYVNTGLTHHWVYIEKEYTVPANITKLNIGIENGGFGSVWFDDVRLFPSNAFVTTYTYDLFGNILSVTDPNNLTQYYEYDTFGRLVRVKDNEGNILEKTEYHFGY